MADIYEYKRIIKEGDKIPASDVLLKTIAVEEDQIIDRNPLSVQITQEQYDIIREAENNHDVVLDGRNIGLASGRFSVTPSSADDEVIMNCYQVWYGGSGITKDGNNYVIVNRESLIATLYETTNLQIPPESIEGEELIGIVGGRQVRVKLGDGLTFEQIGDDLYTLKGATVQTTEPEDSIDDGGLHIVILPNPPQTEYNGYIYMIKEQ